MQLQQTTWTGGHGWSDASDDPIDADLALVFGAVQPITEQAVRAARARYPRALLFGCSTAGEIVGTQVLDDSLVMTAIRFEGTTLHLEHTTISDATQSAQAGRRLGRGLPIEGLRHVLVLSDGLGVNGSELVEGLRAELPDSVSITGGLSADGERFGRTVVLVGDQVERDMIGVLGLYGDRLSVGYGSLGGWDPFGPERLVTRSRGNILYEMDGQSALELYRRYLGEHAAELPASGLLFPLSVRTGAEDIPVVRTLLAIDEDSAGMRFAGDVPEGAYARLMKANVDRLIEGAVGAARVSAELRGSSPDLAILISCVGRRMVLRQRVEEELEGVRSVLGEQTVLTGFYSYGEISPFTPTARCELHNQTMTITTLSERPA